MKGIIVDNLGSIRLSLPEDRHATNSPWHATLVTAITPRYLIVQIGPIIRTVQISVNSLKPSIQPPTLSASVTILPTTLPASSQLRVHHTAAGAIHAIFCSNAVLPFIAIVPL